MFHGIMDALTGGQVKTADGMPHVRLVTVRPFFVGGRSTIEGQVISVDPADAADILGTGRAKLVEPEALEVVYAAVQAKTTRECPVRGRPARHFG